MSRHESCAAGNLLSSLNIIAFQQDFSILRASPESPAPDLIRVLARSTILLVTGRRTSPTSCASTGWTATSWAAVFINSTLVRTLNRVVQIDFSSPGSTPHCGGNQLRVIIARSLPCAMAVGTRNGGRGFTPCEATRHIRIPELRRNFQSPDRAPSFRFAVHSSRSIARPFCS
jgi:hypothetical protein